MSVAVSKVTLAPLRREDYKEKEILLSPYPLIGQGREVELYTHTRR